MENEYFRQLEGFALPGCKTCETAVWPAHVHAHMRSRHHRLSDTMAAEVGRDVNAWPELAQGLHELTVPHEMGHVTPGLTLYRDGLLCRLRSDSCLYICRDLDTLRRHWRVKHGWKTQSRPGRVAVAQQPAVKDLERKASKRVCCQRLLRQGSGSHFFRVPGLPQAGISTRVSSDSVEEGHINVEVDSKVELLTRIDAHWKSSQKKAHVTVQRQGSDDASPWLDRTGWATYLAGISWSDLRAWIEEPGVVSDSISPTFSSELASFSDEVEASGLRQSTEALACTLWSCMATLVEACQASVTQDVGHFLRIEAVRTLRHQTVYRPLVSYRARSTLLRNARYWQQILVFFARTQGEQDRGQGLTRQNEGLAPASASDVNRSSSSLYTFTSKQRQAWRHLVHLACSETDAQTQDQAEISISSKQNSDHFVQSISFETGRAWHGDDDFDEFSSTSDSGSDQNAGQKNNEIEQSRALTCLELACLNFCLSLLDQAASFSEYDCPLVVALAVLGVQNDYSSSSGWKGPDRYPPLLSGVIKLARFMVIRQALQLSPLSSNSVVERSRQSSLKEVGSDDDNSDHAQASQGCLDQLISMMNRFMVRGTRGPMQWMLDLRTYGLAIHYNTTARGHVSWQEPETLLYKQLIFNMSDFRALVHGLRQAANQVLLKELLLIETAEQKNSDLPRIPWASLMDDPTNSEPNWSFLCDSRTHWPPQVDGPSWLLSRILDHPGFRSRFTRPSASGLALGGPTELAPASVKAYLNRVDGFLEKLAVLMHLTGGQPARAPELLSVRHRNSFSGRIRDVFVEDGLVVFFTRYHKGYTLTADTKVIHRYLPREVGELLVWYLWLVLPFQERVQATLWPDQAPSVAADTHLWPKSGPGTRPWTPERLTRVLQRESRLGLRGQALSVRSYREVAIAMSRRFLRAGSDFQCLISDGPGSAQEKDFSAVEVENPLAQAADAQAGHGSHVADMIYARDMMEQDGVTAGRRRRFRVSSVDWHCFLAFPTALACSGLAVSARSGVKRSRQISDFASANEGQVIRRARLQELNLAMVFRTLVGANARFRGLQRPALEAILKGNSPVLAVMPTGGGKSLLFMLPSSQELGGTTVVVVPLITLRADLQARCQKLGIECIEWNPRQPSDGAAIVLVTPEAALTSEFASFLARLKVTHRLDRMVIDECHVTLAALDESFRRKLSGLGTLVQARTQLILLTATLPPRSQPLLLERMYLQSEQLTVFRDLTTRTNLTYRVVWPCPESERELNEAEKSSEYDKDSNQYKNCRLNWCANVIRHQIQGLQSIEAGRLIVYGASVKQVKEMALLLNCEAYHANVLDKSGILARFRRGPFGVIVATSALGMGVDISDVRVVIHLGRPRTLMDYAQESGRAGRDGASSDAIILLTRPLETFEAKNGQGFDESFLSDLTDTSKPWPPSDEEEKTLVQQYLMATCRRIVLDRFLDGRRRSSCENIEARCDQCSLSLSSSQFSGFASNEKESTVSATRRERFNQQDRERQAPDLKRQLQIQAPIISMELLREQLARWVALCGLCGTKNAGPKSNHLALDCPIRSSAIDFGRKLRSRLRFKPYTGCFHCGAPQLVCDKWEPHSDDFGFKKKSNQICQYRNVLISGIISAVAGFHEALLAEAWRLRLAEKNIDLENEQQLIFYLGSKSEHVSETNNLTWEFSWLVQQFEMLINLK